MTRILVVEDDLKDLLEITVKLAFDNNCEVVTTGRGDTAMLLAKSERFDLIVMDILLPGASGIDAIKEIRKRDKDTPIIVISNYPERYSALSIEVGANEFCPKTVGIAQITKRIRGMVEVE